LTNQGKAEYSEVDECDSNRLCRESSNLVSESKMFVKDEAKFTSSVGGVE